MPPHVHTTIRVGGSAAHRDERRVTPAPRRPSGASTGGRVREPRDHRLAAPADRPRAVRQPCREAGNASACQCILSSSGPAAHRGSRRFAPAAARLACQRPARHHTIAPASARPARQQPTTLRLCGSEAAQSAPGGRITRRMLTGRAARARYSATRHNPLFSLGRLGPFL
jgi:hypothetical protein